MIDPLEGVGSMKYGLKKTKQENHATICNQS